MFLLGFTLLIIVSTDMAYSHRGNHAASLHLESLDGVPVLLSGLSALVLSDPEIAAIHHHHKLTLERLQRLHSATPESVVMFLAGSLPITGILHLRMFGLLGMIARLGADNILNKHGQHVLSSFSTTKSNRSWFLKVKLLANKYCLPDPLLVLQYPPTYNHWKSLCKSKVIDWFEQHLRAEASLLPSLLFFQPVFMSLTSPHPIWLNAGSPFEVSKSVVQARMLSGRYRTDRLARHWTPDNPDGYCRLPGCHNEEGNLEHILLHCPALSPSRQNVVKLWSDFMVSRPTLLPILRKYTCESDKLFLQFLLDPSCVPLVISTVKSQPDTVKHCVYLSRTWCFTVHV